MFLIATFAIPKRNGNHFGSLAQLVQSVCLTSRGSGVRLPQLPRKSEISDAGLAFFCELVSFPFGNLPKGNDIWRCPFGKLLKGNKV